MTVLRYDLCAIAAQQPGLLTAPPVPQKSVPKVGSQKPLAQLVIAAADIAGQRRRHVSTLQFLHEQPFQTLGVEHRLHQPRVLRPIAGRHQLVFRQATQGRSLFCRVRDGFKTQRAAPFVILRMPASGAPPRLPCPTVSGRRALHRSFFRLRSALDVPGHPRPQGSPPRAEPRQPLLALQQWLPQWAPMVERCRPSHSAHGMPSRFNRSPRPSARTERPAAGLCRYLRSSPPPARSWPKTLRVSRPVAPAARRQRHRRLRE